MISCLNGTEIGGGSIRIYQRELTGEKFSALGMSKEEAQEKFGSSWAPSNTARHTAWRHRLRLRPAFARCRRTGNDPRFIAFPKNNSGPGCDDRCDPVRSMRSEQELG
jgi:aspartyl-tRNA synthetase